MSNLYSNTTNQAAIIALFRLVSGYVGYLPPMSGVFPDYPAPVIRNTEAGTEMTTMHWGMPGLFCAALTKRTGQQPRRRRT
jgi:putative SOS response-associated peptidase YedK